MERPAELPAERLKITNNPEFPDLNLKKGYAMLIDFLLELLWKFIEKILKKDPESMTFGELKKIAKTAKFKAFASGSH